MGLRFEQKPDGTVVGHFACDSDYQGYPNRLHGGVVSMLLDAAMTHCLFARGIQAVTGKLNVRFRHPVIVGKPATFRARLVKQRAPLYTLQAELTQRGKTCALADARFFSEQS
ncbi:MAG: PaaI family thioesterase [Phycisphaerales bacterium]|nr:MAG: PaaI family thioesterase [Phycisphaerales bacterium]